MSGTLNLLVGDNSSAVLPTGPSGVWYMDQYQATPRKAIPNALSAVAVSQNLLIAPRNMFANTSIWEPAGATATDSGLTGPDGFSDASTYVAAGNHFLDPAAGIGYPVLPAGTYTLAIWAKRNTGSDQQFCLSFFSSGSSSPTKTATSTWQRFTYTATLGGGTERVMPIRSFDGATGANLQICGAELFAGSSDLGVAPSSHLYLGPNQYDTATAFGSGAVDFQTTGAFGLIQFPSDQAPTSFTAVAIAKKSATAGVNNQAFLSRVDNFGSLTAYLELMAVPDVQFGATGFSQGGNQLTGLWDFFYESGTHMLTSRYDGTSGDVYVDDQRLSTQTGSATPATWRDLWVGVVNGVDLRANYKIYAIAYWPRALSHAEVAMAYSVLKARVLAQSSITMTTLRTLIADGDSNTQGSGVTGYPYLFGPNSSPKLVGANWAIAGTGIAEMIARGPALRAGVPAAAGRKLIYTYMPGNQLSGYSGGTAQYAADLFAEMDLNRAAGLTVGLVTAPPRSAAADVNFNTARNVLNPLIRAAVGTHCDFVIDFAADATIGPDAAASNTTYYNGGLHLTAAAMTIAEGIYRTAVNAI